MDHLRRLGNSISIPISADEAGFTGRECPQPDCEGCLRKIKVLSRRWRSTDSRKPC